MVIFYVLTHFLDPMGPHWPQDGPFNFHFFRKIDDRGIVKKFWGMVIFYGFDPFFGPNGTPLAPRWTLGGPTVIWSDKRKFHFLWKIDDHGVVENSNFGAW